MDPDSGVSTLTYRWTIALAAAATVVGCQQPGRSDEAGEVEVGSAPPAVEAPAEPQAALLAADERVFDLVLPQGALPDGGAGGTQHFRIDADFDDLLAFYEEQLPEGYRLTRYERGAQFESTDSGGRSVYLYRERGSGWLITYFDAGADPSLAAADSEQGRTTVGGGTTVAGGAGSANPGPDGSEQTAPSGAGRRPSEAPEARSLPRTPAELDDRVGEVYQGDPDAYVPEAGGAPEVIPRVHPRVEALIRAGEVGTGNRRPLNFTRGVREPRRNSDAMF